MEFGIGGRKAIVCASSRGLGRACAHGAGAAGCEVVVNGRDGKVLEQTAAEISKATGATVIPVQADVATPEGQAALFAACPEPDILVNNNAGPPFRDFRQLHAADDDRRRDRQHGGGGRTDAESHRPDGAAEIRPHRQHHVGLGEDAARRPRPLLGRARRPHGVLRRAWRARSPASNVTINFLLPGTFDTERLATNIAANAKTKGISFDQAQADRMATVPAKRFGTADEFGAACAFLCSAQAGYITGQNLLIDGGAFPGAM